MQSVVRVYLREGQEVDVPGKFATHYHINDEGELEFSDIQEALTDSRGIEVSALVRAFFGAGEWVGFVEREVEDGQN